ncbi:hypothetical protein H0H87_012537 [Tephrocybe sp. NHM501043]|nr:hypothetical protein H0H87_012537 [Tephrocybe sp. NHM501043]
MVNTRFSSYIKPGLIDTLPDDLKREILEITAYMYPPFALRMAVVSREIQQWSAHSNLAMTFMAERIIYRELFFSGQRLYHRGDTAKPTPLQMFKVALETRPPEFFAEYVRALHFDGTCVAEEILPIVQVCTGVTNFGMYASIEGPRTVEIARLVHSLPLHTLFISNTNLTALLAHDTVQTPTHTKATPEDPNADAPNTSEAQTDADSDANIDDSFTQVNHDAPEALLEPLPSSSLHKLQRLGIVDGFEYPARRFPALTHLALIPDAEDRIIKHVRTALSDPRIESIVVMLNYVNAPRQIKTLRALRDITDSRVVIFTLPVSPTRYLEDDLWDLANEFPDEEQLISKLFDM